MWYIFHVIRYPILIYNILYECCVKIETKILNNLPYNAYNIKINCTKIDMLECSKTINYYL